MALAFHRKMGGDMKFTRSGVAKLVIGVHCVTLSCGLVGYAFIWLLAIQLVILHNQFVLTFEHIIQLHLLGVGPLLLVCGALRVHIWPIVSHIGSDIQAMARSRPASEKPSQATQEEVLRYLRGALLLAETSLARSNKSVAEDTTPSEPVE